METTQTANHARLVSETLLAQLTGGGNGMARLAAMVGATNFTYSQAGETTFHFKLCKKSNMVKVALTSADLYDVTFYKFNRKTYELKTAYQVEGVYADQLQSIFVSFTGLDTML